METHKSLQAKYTSLLNTTGLPENSRFLKVPFRADRPARASGAPGEPGGGHEEQASQTREPRPGDQARREAGEHVLQQDRLRELPEGEHEGPHPRVVLYLRSHVRTFN